MLLKISLKSCNNNKTKYKMNNKQLLMNYYYPIYKRSIKRLLLYFFFYNFNYNFISKYPPFLSVIEELQEFQ